MLGQEDARDAGSSPVLAVEEKAPAGPAGPTLAVGLPGDPATLPIQPCNTAE